MQALNNIDLVSALDTLLSYRSRERALRTRSAHPKAPTRRCKCSP